MSTASWIPTPPVVLVVDDEADDVELLREGFRMCGLTTHIHEVGSGEDALRFLRRLSPYEQAPLPDLVLLDLGLPGMSGWDLLEVLKVDDQLRLVPVVVVTSSDTAEDVNRAYRSRANAFLAKPTQRRQYVEMASGLAMYWFKHVASPSRGSGT